MAVSRGSLHDDGARLPFDPDTLPGLLADDVRDGIRRRTVSLHARLRVADAIYALALDIVGEAGLSDDDRTWLRQRIAGPVSEATEEALSVLTQELSEALRAAPPRMRPPMLDANLVTRTDFE